jgi:hypothetical protein
MQIKERREMSDNHTSRIGRRIRQWVSFSRKPKASGPAGSLEATVAWGHIERTWDVAHRIVEGDLTAAPRSRRSEKKFVKSLQQSRQDIHQLSQDGLLNSCEKDLLLAHHEFLHQSVLDKLDLDRDTTASRTVVPARRSVQRLSDRLGLLQDLHSCDALHPRAVHRILQSLQSDVETLSNRAMLQQLAVARRAEAGDLRNRVSALIEDLRRRLLGYQMTG